MTNLIRNCAHFSTHQTLIDTGNASDDARTIKTTFTAEGVGGLRAEYEGLKWYASRLNTSIDTIVYNFRSTPGYARLVVRYIDGAVIPMPTDPGTLSGKIDTALKYYVDNLWDGTNTPSHGDFSLSNHVFDPQGQIIGIIDWEHFNNDLPAQYDPLYMILEPLLFWHVNGKKLNDGVISATKAHIAKLHQHVGLDDESINAPASWLRLTAGTHVSVWGEQASKVPFLNAHEHDVFEIDQRLSAA